MKQFVVIGLGRFGVSVATELYRMGHEVLAIDRSVERVEEIADSVTHAVCADATDEAELGSLGLRNFDVAVVSIGSDLQASILVTMLCKELGVKYVLTKAKSDLHAKVLQRVGADKVVFPERDMGCAHGRTTSCRPTSWTTSSSRPTIPWSRSASRRSGWARTCGSSTCACATASTSWPSATSAGTSPSRRRASTPWRRTTCSWPSGSNASISKLEDMAGR